MKQGGGGFNITPFPLCNFVLYSKFSDDPYFYFSQLVVADTPMNKKSKNLGLPPMRAFWDTED